MAQVAPAPVDRRTGWEGEVVSNSIPEGKSVRWKGYPTWIKSFVYEAISSEALYPDYSEMPEELRPMLPILPFDWEDAALRHSTDSLFKNLVMDQLINYCIHPHMVYMPVLYMMIQSRMFYQQQKEPRKFMGDVLKDAFRVTVNAHEVYYAYRILAYWLHSHVMHNVKKDWSAMVNRAMESHSRRVAESLSCLKTAVLWSPGVRQLCDTIKTDRNAPVASFYDGAIARQMCEISFKHCVSVLNSLELTIMEILCIDPSTGSKLLTPFDVPPERAVMRTDAEWIPQIEMSYVMCANKMTPDNQHVFDIAHIGAHNTCELWLVSPSMVFQSVLYAVGIRERRLVKK